MHSFAWLRFSRTCLPLLLLGSACKSSTASSPMSADVSAKITPLSVYHPVDASTYKYNHAAMITPFQGDLYVMWSAASKDEDVDVDVVYAFSKDQGATWGVAQAPFQVMATHTRGGLSLQSAGWWSHEGKLVAYIGQFNTWYGPGQKQTSYRVSTDGQTWSDPQPLLGADGKPLQASMEESPKQIGNRLFTTFNLQNEAATALVQSPFYTDDLSGVSGWTKAAFALDPFTTGSKQGKELEGSIFRGGDHLYTVYRNMKDNTLLRSASDDLRGEHWAASTDWLPVGQNKSSAGNLPNGKGFFLANPNNASGRFPLNLYLTADGIQIDHTVTLLTMDPAEPSGQVRYPGLYKGPGFSYPNSYTDTARLLIAYARHKEDIEIIVVPAATLETAGN